MMMTTKGEGLSSTPSAHAPPQVELLFLIYCSRTWSGAVFPSIYSPGALSSRLHDAPTTTTTTAAGEQQQQHQRMDPAMQEAAGKLADFVAKNGRQYEDMTRERNPGDTTFK